MSPGTDRAYRAAFYQAVDQRQAADPRQRRYYVPIYDDPALKGQDVVGTLLDGIAFTAGESVQILSGFRGSGKTSELLRLQQELEAEGYAVVYFDIEDYFNTELPVELGGFALALAAGFADGCADKSLELSNDGPRQRLLGLLSRLKIEPSVTVGPLNLKTSLREDESFRARVTQTMKGNRAEFRQELHTFFDESASALGGSKGTVFIVDSIDHFRGRTERFQEVRESVETVFSELAEDLVLPGMHVIYTVPVYVQPALGLRRDVLNIKVAMPDGTPFSPGRECLQAVLAARAPDGDLDRLLAGEQDRLLAASGGLFRDLLRLTGELLLTSDQLPVGASEVGRAESVVRSNMEMALSQEQVDILRGVSTSHQLTPSKSEWADATDLMARGAILRYPNGDRPWYGVHPLLTSLL